MYEFGGSFYRTRREMYLAVAEAWLSACGRNSREQIQDALNEVSNEDFAGEAHENWSPRPGEGEAWDRKGLAEAFAEVRRTLR